MCDFTAAAPTGPQPVTGACGLFCPSGLHAAEGGPLPPRLTRPEHRTLIFPACEGAPNPFRTLSFMPLTPTIGQGDRGIPPSVPSPLAPHSISPMGWPQTWQGFPDESFQSLFFLPSVSKAGLSGYGVNLTRTSSQGWSQLGDSNGQRRENSAQPGSHWKQRAQLMGPRSGPVDS